MSGAGRVLGAAAVALLGACSLLIDLDPGVRDPAGKGDGGIDDSDGGFDDADAGPCGSISRLEDSFPPGPLSKHWVPRAQGDEAAQPFIDEDGRLNLGFATAPATDSEFSDLESRFAYDLRGHAVTVWADVVDDRSWSTLEIREAADFAAERRIFALGRKGTVFAAFVRTPTENVLRQEVWNSSLYRYWRIREVAGGLDFQVAGSDHVFSSFETLEVAGIDLGTVMVGLAVNADATPVTVGLTRFDDLGTGEAAEPACPVDTLRDDFVADQLRSIWIAYSDGCTVSTGDGLLLDAAAGGTCIVDSAHAYSIAGGGALTVDLAGLADGAGSRTELRLVNDGQDYLALQQEDGELSIVVVEGGVGGAPDTVGNPSSAQRWRIREQDGDLVVETAGGSGSFTPRATVSPSGLDLSELRVSFQLRAAGTDSARVSSVNILP